MTTSTAGRIEWAVNILGDGETGAPVSITDLRDMLADIATADLDVELIALYAAQRLNLVPRSCQQLLTTRDRAAAVEVGGERKHLVIWG